MIHFMPIAAFDAECDGGQPELLARVAGLRRALRLVDPFGGGPAGDPEDDVRIDHVPNRVAPCFDRRSERVVASAAAGLDAVVSVRSTGQDANVASLDLLAREIRAGLADLSSLVRV